MKQKIGQDVVKFYAPYKNNSTKIKTFNLSNQKFQVPDRYQIIDIIGRGAYGIVVAARDKQSISDKKIVAIKKIYKAFEHKIYTRRTLRQIKLLNLLKHQNIVGISNIILPKSREDFEDIYIVSELMETDLATIIQSEQPLSDKHVQFFLYQILRGLKYIHSANVIHRDLKPRNLLINSNCDLKICDFGLSRTILPNENMKINILTDYVATRWYRAPELLLHAKQYTFKIDMWSVGCIFAEMLKRRPFLTGTDTKNQIQLICQYLGTPNVDTIKNLPQESKKLIKLLPKRVEKSFQKIFECASPQAVDLLKKLLMFDPDKRISVEQALAHPYVAHLHLEQDQPTRQSLHPLDFEFEQHNLTMQQLKDIIYEQILINTNKQFKQNYETKKKKNQSLITHILKNSNGKLFDKYADSDDM